MSRMAKIYQVGVAGSLALTLLVFSITLTSCKILLAVDSTICLVNFASRAIPSTKNEEDKRIDPRTSVEIARLQEYYFYRFLAPRTLPSNEPLIAISTITIPSPKKNRSDNVHLMSNAIHIQYAKLHGFDFFSLQKPFPHGQTRKHRKPAWQKIPSTNFILNISHPYLRRKYDYVFWVDGDSIIMNFSASLITDIVGPSPNKDIILSGDTLIVNTGHILWKNSPFTKWFLEILWNMFDEKEVGRVKLDENGYMASMLGGCWPNNTAKEKAQCYEKVDFFPRKTRGSKTVRKQMHVARQIARADISSVQNLANWSIESIHWIDKRRINSYSTDYQNGDFLFHAAGSRCKTSLIHQKFQDSIEVNHLNVVDLVGQSLLDSNTDSWMWLRQPQQCWKKNPSNDPEIELLQDKHTVQASSTFRSFGERYGSR
mmetsp:Transcript_21079/g.58389  ORF Transcript_21079/g.58389 Transcript_21079/m.58389 type:complete len:428 (-) Transcript_21079:414-1697(-)